MNPLNFDDEKPMKIWRRQLNDLSQTQILDALRPVMVQPVSKHVSIQHRQPELSPAAIED